ncbi:hypothetical protein EDF46_1625 [Frondihabitans sp. PhB188]|uniref:hypothetical protein n=1 Tax=Frondihabitans sp. PhB188 TaxID=2485200 RepID=UPI000F4895E5|nr:hypothetical protein [Frondihabitans sp. PhB188]ROQ39990.1 hypothetical protein EDF46_1625 [Frondihabitans sp. PhB188]
MTSTNRPLNRLFLAVVGLVFLAVGAFLVAAALPGRSVVRDWIGRARDAQDTALKSSAIGQPAPFDGSYLPWGLAVVCLVVVLVAVIAAIARGGGRTDRVVEVDEPAGRIVVSSQFAETALVDALQPRRDIAAVSVASYQLKGAPALKLRLRLTAGSSPVPAVRAASEAVTGLDAVLGGPPLPVLVEVVGASPVRPGADSRVS